jgi:hypothetical protein
MTDDDTEHEEEHLETENVLRAWHAHLLRLEAIAREHGLDVPPRPEGMGDENIRKILGDDKPEN